MDNNKIKVYWDVNGVRKMVGTADVTIAGKPFGVANIAIEDEATKEAVADAVRPKVTGTLAYSCRLECSPGVFVDADGVEHKYDFIERERKIEHVAIDAIEGDRA